MIEKAATTDIDAILELLVEAGLHEEEVGRFIDSFLVLREEDGRIAGAVGMEVYGPVALLRSMVVKPSLRGGGMARRLIKALLDEAVNRGVSEMYLLTIDADGFFAHMGFETVERDIAPMAIRKTWEFSVACPDSALFMRKLL